MIRLPHTTSISEVLSLIVNLTQLTFFSVRQYLSGTGNHGGALVTTTNKTVQSDLRLFESDNNRSIEKYVTYALNLAPGTKGMVRLAQSPQHFNSICSNLIARMIDAGAHY
jgi:hypothetical protein